MSEQYPGGYITKSPVVPNGTTAPGIWNLSQQAAYQAAGTWPNVIPVDAQFNYVTMLLHGDGTNGGQNGTFVDSSSYARTFTKLGNPTQGSFSPYGSNWSNQFGGNYIYAPNNVAFGFGTGDLTVEAWVFPTSYGTASNIYTTPENGGFVFYVTGGNLVVRTYGTADILSSSTIPALNTWTHVAATRSGTTLRIFVNGVQTASVSNSTNFPSSLAIVGNDGSNTSPWTGYISNLRVVKGTAVYTSAFTPSTTPLTAISGTSLLTCQSNRFIDNSSNAFALTISGTPSVQRFNPFGTSTAYSTATFGGSGGFNGTSDAIRTSYFNLSGDFTIEGWFYRNDSSDAITVSGQPSPGSTENWQILRFGYPATNTVYTYLNGLGDNSWSNAIVPKAWTYLALVRSGSTITLYSNGVALGSFVNGTTIPYTTLGCFDYSGSPYQWFNGEVTDFRVSNIAKYSSTFSVPTTPQTTSTGSTLLLMNFTNGAIYDNAMMNDLRTLGNAQISTSVKKYGTGSLAFDGTGDYLTTNTGVIGAFGTGDFTIEMWVYFNNLSDYQYLIDFRPDSTNGAYITLQTLIGTDNIILYANSGTQITGASSSISAGTWIHVALCRASGSTRLFINGTQSGSTYADTTNYLVGPRNPVIAANAYTLGTYCVNGYIDDLRITNGYARYTTTFTPPSAALPNIGPTV